MYYYAEWGCKPTYNWGAPPCNGFRQRILWVQGPLLGSTGTHSARHAYSANNLDDFGVPHFNTPPDGLKMV
jgi:hypothetical protein